MALAPGHADKLSLSHQTRGPCCYRKQQTETPPTLSLHHLSFSRQRSSILPTKTDKQSLFSSLCLRTHQTHNILSRKCELLIKVLPKFYEVILTFGFATHFKIKFYFGFCATRSN